MGLRPRAFLASGLGIVAVLAGGCGSTQGLLSAHAHDALSADFLAVRQAVAKGSCAETKDAIAQVQTTLDGLSSDTDAKLVQNLNQGTAVLRQNALRQCHHQIKPPTTTTTTSTSTNASTTTATGTTPATSTSTPPPATTTTSTPPPATTGTTPPATNTTPAATTTSNGGTGLDNGDQ